MNKYRQVITLYCPTIDAILTFYKLYKTYRKRVLLRFRLCSANDGVLHNWEPYWPSFEERRRCLWLAHELGFQTSVCIEPMLDNNPDVIVEAVKPYVTEAIWLDKAKSLKQLQAAYGGCDTKRKIAKANKLLKLQSAINLKALHQRLKRDPQVRWGKTIQKAIGLKGRNKQQCSGGLGRLCLANPRGGLWTIQNQD